MNGTIEKIFITPRGSLPMQSVSQVEAVEKGLAGDRYCEKTGYWTGVDECQVTLIEGEDLDQIAEQQGISVHGGEHRRNLVTRNIRLETLSGQQFRIGEAVFAWDRPRPPCAYIESITEPGMTRALSRCGGICVRVVKPGLIKVGDAIELLER